MDDLICNCGGKAISEHEGTSYFVYCLECEKQTETYVNEEIAINEWVKIKR